MDSIHRELRYVDLPTGPYKELILKTRTPLMDIAVNTIIITLFIFIVLGAIRR